VKQWRISTPTIVDEELMLMRGTEIDIDKDRTFYVMLPPNFVTIYWDNLRNAQG
jgi:hypothetical protein